MATNGNLNHQDQYTGPTMPAQSESSGSAARDLSKDEVGWYFVEQYYTTLSKNPEKLHLFYGKKSQFVYGLEADVAGVSVGRPSIQDRIKQLDFQDCKVRISNVDSQGSSENIVIQVIGETSNKSEEPKKFVQTFVLAQQPSGYFVLNDILRYIKDEPEEEAVEQAAPEEAAAKVTPAAQEPEAQAEAEAQPDSAEAEEPQLDATVVDKKLEEAGAATKETPSTSAVNTPAEPAAAAAPQETTAKTEAATEALDPDKTVKEIAEEEVKKPEVPKDPSPTPVAPRAQAPVAAEPEKPKEPVKPRSWAAAAAAAAGPKPAAVAMPKPATAPQARAPVPVAAAAAPQAAAPAAAPAAAAPAAEAAAAPKESGNEWQTAGSDSKRQNRPQSMSTAPQEKEGTLGYVKYVTEKVTDKDLRAHLASFGDIVYFDINRAKNCAFVEFGTVAAYQAAISSNPHVVNGENIVVEPRRPKAGAYGGSNYANRGSISGRGRGGFEGNRSGSQGGGRGGFGGGQPRGRGAPGNAPRGRGQATNA